MRPWISRTSAHILQHRKCAKFRIWLDFYVEFKLHAVVNDSKIGFVSILGYFCN